MVFLLRRKPSLHAGRECTSPCLEMSIMAASTQHGQTLSLDRIASCLVKTRFAELMS